MIHDDSLPSNENWEEKAPTTNQWMPCYAIVTQKPIVFWTCSHSVFEHGTFSALSSMLYMRGNCKIWLGFSPLVNRYNRVIVCYSYHLTCNIYKPPLDYIYTCLGISSGFFSVKFEIPQEFDLGFRILGVP